MYLFLDKRVVMMVVKIDVYCHTPPGPLKFGIWITDSKMKSADLHSTTTSGQSLHIRGSYNKIQNKRYKHYHGKQF